ncbi:hypothetical protein EV715DRAFT_267289 [Schizophyllum commune]
MTQVGSTQDHSGNLTWLPVIEVDRQMCEHIGIFDMGSNRILRPLENLRRPHLVEHAKESIIALSDYTSLFVDTFSFQYDALEGLRQFIDGERDSAKTSAVLHSNGEATVIILTRAVTTGCRVLDSLSALQRHVIKDLSYPPGVHFIIHLLGLDWNTRGLALKTVPKAIKEISANVQSLVALVVRLKGYANNPHFGVSVSILADIANMPQDRRMQVASLVKQIAWELYSLRRRARETADYIRDLATRESTALDSATIPSLTASAGRAHKVTLRNRCVGSSADPSGGWSRLLGARMAAVVRLGSPSTNIRATSRLPYLPLDRSSSKKQRRGG